MLEQKAVKGSNNEKIHRLDPGTSNVGKSTLFNRLCRKRVAIVDFEAGITRDRKYEDVEWNGKIFKLIDTGGIVYDSDETMDKMIMHQAILAIDESDLIISWWMPRPEPLIWTRLSLRFCSRIGIK
jgi:tRNA U34 5-carboxymethylaminomethyl modifying GTPase MnmE/TrmE